MDDPEKKERPGLLRRIDWARSGTYFAIVSVSAALGFVVSDFFTSFFPVLSEQTIIEHLAGGLSGLGSAISGVKLAFVKKTFHLQVDGLDKEVCVEVFREEKLVKLPLLKRVGKYEGMAGPGKHHAVLRNITWTGYRRVEAVQIGFFAGYNRAAHRVKIPQPLVDDHQTVYVHLKSLKPGKTFTAGTTIDSCSHLFEYFPSLGPDSSNDSE